jgi:hypothetical protein
MDILAAALVAAIVLVAALLLLGKPVAGKGAGKAGKGLLSRGLEARRRDRDGKAGGRRGAAAASPAGQGPPLQGGARRCPLCGSGLSGGERVKSDLTPGTGDRIMRIFGCPHCWPALPDKAPRLCPVCGGEIPADGHAVARYFERPGRRHVHVLGCSRCRPHS